MHLIVTGRLAKYCAFNVRLLKAHEKVLIRFRSHNYDFSTWVVQNFLFLTLFFTDKVKGIMERPVLTRSLSRRISVDSTRKETCSSEMFQKALPCPVHSVGETSGTTQKVSEVADCTCCSIEDLPFDILVQIFAHFDSVELHKLAGVCRTWNLLISDFFLRHTISLTLERREHMPHSVYLGNGRYEWYKHVFQLFLGSETRTVILSADPVIIQPEDEVEDISRYYFAIYHDFERIFTHLTLCKDQMTENFTSVTFVNLLLPMEAFQYTFPDWIKEIKLKNCTLAASFLNGLGAWWGDEQEILLVEVDDGVISMTELKTETASWDFVAKTAGPLNQFQEAAVMTVLNSTRSAWDIVKLLVWSEGRYRDFMEVQMTAADLAISVDILRGFKLSTQHILLCYVNHMPSTDEGDEADVQEDGGDGEVP